MSTESDGDGGLRRIGRQAKEAAGAVGLLTTARKNDALLHAARKLLEREANILEQNEKDVQAAMQNGMSGALLDRLTLNAARIAGMAEGLKTVAALPDPIGETVSAQTLENGLTIAKRRVPMGVVGIIYEARPNVTADAAGLCFKAGSAVILRGGKEAVHSNTAIAETIQEALSERGASPFAVQLIKDTSRESAVGLMKLSGFVDVLVPRGSAGLIRSVVENASVPVIETGVGNCHIFVDETANLENAADIVMNAKTQRPGVCNACEKLLVHARVAEKFLPAACAALAEAGVEVRGCEKTRAIVPNALPAAEADWDTEYLDLMIGVKVVAGIDEAIRHINQYGSGHSEAILTESYTNSRKFSDAVDAACVYVNASTRFTDGGEFGFGAELGISTQKLHARGPMGLRELTSYKYVITGDGQIRL